MVEEQPIQSMPLLEHVQRPSARRSLPFPPPPITLYSPPSANRIDTAHHDRSRRDRGGSVSPGRIMVCPGY